MQVPFVDTAIRLIGMKTDFAAKIAVIRTERRMQAELLRATAPELRPPQGVGRAVDKRA